MLVMKFKGAVLQNQETLAEIKNRIKEQNCCSIVVVSALKGVMPRLRQLYGLSLRRGTGFDKEFNELKYPVLLGTSRKSVIGLTLDLPAAERVEGTIVTTVMAVEAGCMFVRVHDVKENHRAIQMAEAILDRK